MAPALSLVAFSICQFSAGCLCGCKIRAAVFCMLLTDGLFFTYNYVINASLVCWLSLNGAVNSLSNKSADQMLQSDR